MYPKSLKVLSVLLAASVFGLVWYNYKQLIEICLTLNPYWVIVGLGCYVANYIFRSLRLKKLADDKIAFLNQAFHFSAVHGFLSYLLPMRSGDVSLPILLKTTGKITLKEGALILISTRILDLTAIGAFSVIASVFGARGISATIQFIWFLTGMALALSFAWINRLEWIGSLIFKKNNKLKFSRSLKNSSDTICVTVAIWVFMYAGQLCVVRAMGLDLTLSEILFISAIQFPLQLMPVQGLANTGNHEGGWVTAMALMEFSTAQGLEYALVSHGILIVYVGFLGLLSVAAGGFKLSATK